MELHKYNDKEYIEYLNDFFNLKKEICIKEITDEDQRDIIRETMISLIKDNFMDMEIRLEDEHSDSIDVVVKIPISEIH